MLPKMYLRTTDGVRVVLLATNTDGDGNYTTCEWRRAGTQDVETSPFGDFFGTVGNRYLHEVEGPYEAARDVFDPHPKRPKTFCK